MKRVYDFSNKVDHFELIEEISERLKDSAQEIDTIRQEFEGITDARQKLARSLILAEVLIAHCKQKFSIMREEEYKIREFEIDNYLKSLDFLTKDEEKVQLSFDNVDF